MTWLKHYVDYASSVSESPTYFHTWIGLWTLSAILGRRVVLQMRNISVMPNMFLFVVGPSGIVQKSSSVDIGLEFVYALPDVFVSADRFSRAYLVKEAAAYVKQFGECPMVLVASELRTAFNEMSLKENLLETLTRLWDNPQHGFDTSLASTGKQQIKNVSVTFAACSTPEWLVSGLAPDEVGGGFSGRVIYVYGDVPSKRLEYETELPVAAKAAYEVCTEEAKRIAMLKGTMSITPEAASIWNLSRVVIDKRYQEADARVRPFYGRLQIHLLKTAILLSVSESSALVVEDRHIIEAGNLLDEVPYWMLRAMRGVGGGRAAQLTDIVVDAIREHGPISRSALLRRVYAAKRGTSAFDVGNVITTLLEAEMVTASMERIEGSRKGSTVYTIAKRKRRK